MKLLSNGQADAKQSPQDARSSNIGGNEHEAAHCCPTDESILLLAGLQARGREGRQQRREEAKESEERRDASLLAVAATATNVEAASPPLPSPPLTA